MLTENVPSHPPVKPYPSCSFGSVRASIAASTHSSASAPVEAVTPAAKAPSTKGASTRVTRSLFSEGSISRTVSAERTALPRSMKTSTSSVSRSLIEASILSGSVPKEPSASPRRQRSRPLLPSARPGQPCPRRSPCCARRARSQPSGSTFKRSRRGIQQHIRRGRPRILMPRGPGPQIARPSPLRRERDRRLGPFLRGISRAPEHRGHAPFAGGLFRGFDGGFEGIDDRLVPHLGLTALPYAAEGGFQSFGSIFGRDLFFVPEGRRGAQERGAVERAGGPADLVDQGHRDGLQYVGRARRVRALQTFERGLKATVHVVAVVAVPDLRV